MMYDPMTYWDELAATALIGTARRPNVPAPPEALAAFGAQEAGDSAAALLDLAAAAAIYVRAGMLPPVGEAAGFPPAPPDDRPACSAEAARHLALILEDPQRSDLREWLAALAVVGLRLPDGRLPDLLDLGRNEPALGDLVRPVLGSRGHWLAGLNPEWAYALVHDDPLKRWREGDRAGRRAALVLIRATDPAQARELIAEAWPHERADERAALVQILAAGLSMDDEPWLESALDDRSREVRRQVADLLTHLPRSRLAERMTARALRLVQLEWNRRISITLPNLCDDAMQRDGIEPKPPRSDLGERAWWLLQIIARTPPDTWNRTWKLSTAKMMAAAPEEWQPLLIEGWQLAAAAYGHVEWAGALLERAFAGDATVRMEVLAPLLPATKRDDLLLRLLGPHHRPTGRELAVFRAVPTPWSEQVARAVLAAVVRHLRKPKNDPRGDWPLRLVVDYADAFPAHIADLAVTMFPPELTDHPFWVGVIPAFLDRLRFRRSMLAALRAGHQA